MITLKRGASLANQSVATPCEQSKTLLRTKSTRTTKLVVEEPGGKTLLTTGYVVEKRVVQEVVLIPHPYGVDAA
jgi:hypothetical protein